MTAAAAALLYLLLVLPDHPGALTPGALAAFPLELPAILILLAAAPRPIALPFRVALTVALTLTSVLKLADLATQVAFVRPFNPVLDLGLIVAGGRLLTGAAGGPLALAAAGALALTPVLLAAALWWAAGRMARLRIRPALSALALPVLALAALDVDGRPDPPGAALTSRIAWAHLRDGWQALGDLARFRAEAAADPYAALPPDAVLPALRDTDVFVIFVESYGRAALTSPRYAPEITAVLGAAESELGAAGLTMRSGFLRSPVVGGQSWLAHASVLSGLWVDNQARYHALLASPRRSLMHLARAAGWRTVAVMPAITLAWPEAGWFGYDRMLAARDLGYNGLPFNWVTMPDQFTLAAFERLALQGPRPPVFAEIALISSHAPWTPIPPMLPWDALGDGRGFDRYAAAGDPPEVVWRDADRVRRQYRQALAYSLSAVTGFAARRAADPPLIVVLGDHQPAAFVSEDASRDVPVHVIGAPAALARLEGWGWTPGLIPVPDAPVWRMDRFRDRFLAAFADEAPPLRRADSGELTR